MSHQLIKLLNNLGIIDENQLYQYYPFVRDRKDVAVLRCKKSGVIVLSRIDHLSDSYYQKRSEKNSISVGQEEVKTPRLPDNIRRAKDFGNYIRGKEWLDFGCGLGGMLDEIGKEAKCAVGLEPNEQRLQICESKGHQVMANLEEIDNNSLDIITMFHVMEHLTNPLEILLQLWAKLRLGGILLIEVPHARDALFNLYDCESFKQFTFWSEHLVLHTRQSLELLIRESGFQKIYVTGYQRYPLANHLYWLAKSNPGGHDKWSFMLNESLDESYEATLARLDMTDTLLCQARKLTNP